MLGPLLVIALGCQGEEGAICQFELLAANRVVAINWDGVALSSEDHGKTWTRSTSIWMRDLLKVSDSEIWGSSYAIGDGRLSWSSDGGGTWSTVTVDSKRFVPQGFLGIRDGSPVLVGTDGQVWQWQRSKVLKAGGTDWTRVGVPNPDGKASDGILVGDVIYVGSWGRIWRSTDMGASWTAFAAGDEPFVAFASSESTCWATTRDGTVLRVDRGKHDWVVVATIPKVFSVFSIATAGDGVLVAGEQEPLAFVVIVHADGRIDPLPRPKGKQAYKVEVDRDGVVWVGTSSGLFRRVEDRWDQAWPRE